MHTQTAKPISSHTSGRFDRVRKAWHTYLLSSEIAGKNGLAKVLLPRELREEVPRVRQRYEEEVANLNGKNKLLFYATIWQREADVFNKIEKGIETGVISKAEITQKLRELESQMTEQNRKPEYHFNQALTSEIKFLNEAANWLEESETIKVKCFVQLTTKHFVLFTIKHRERCEINVAACRKSADACHVDIKERSAFLDVFVRMPVVTTITAATLSGVFSFFDKIPHPITVMEAIFEFGSLMVLPTISGIAALYITDNIELITNGWKQQKGRIYDSMQGTIPILFTIPITAIGLRISLVSMTSAAGVLFGLIIMSIKKFRSSMLGSVYHEARRDIVKEEMKEYKPEPFLTNLKRAWEDLDKPVAALVTATVITITAAAFTAPAYSFLVVPVVAATLWFGANSHRYTQPTK